MSTENRVAVLSAFSSDFSTLTVEHRPIPTPKAGEVLVRVTCRPVNPADVLSLLGVYPGFRPQSFPATPGLEGCGVIHDANGAAQLTNGQRVIVFFDAINGNGSWQDYVCVPAGNVLPYPDSISQESAAQFLVNPVTVIGMLDVLAAPAGSWVIQSAAGSTLGRQFIAVAKKRGIKTINIVRRAEQAAELLAIGADEVIVFPRAEETAATVAARVRELTGGAGAWGAIDAVAGEMTNLLAQSVRNGGHVYIYGVLSGITATAPVADLLFRGVHIEGFWLSSYLHGASSEKKVQVFGEVIALMASGELVPNSGESFQLEDAVKAVFRTNEAARGGKVLLV